MVLRSALVLGLVAFAATTAGCGGSGSGIAGSGGAQGHGTGGGDAATATDSATGGSAGNTDAAPDVDSQDSAQPDSLTPDAPTEDASTADALSGSGGSGSGGSGSGGSGSGGSGSGGSGSGGSGSGGSGSGGSGSGGAIAIGPTGLPVSIQTASSRGHVAQIAVDYRGLVHVVWQDNCAQFGECTFSAAGSYPDDVYHRAYNPSTGQWTNIRQLSVNLHDGRSEFPTIATDASGNLHVAWRESGDLDDDIFKGSDGDIVYRVLDTQDPDPTKWSLSTTELLTYTTEDEDEPRLSIGPDGTIHLVWEHIDGAGDDVIYVRKATTDTTWSAPIRVSQQDANGKRVGSSALPAVAGDVSGCAHIVWEFNTLIPPIDWDIYYRKICPGAPETIRLVSDSTLDGSASIMPDVAVDGSGNAFVVWQDDAKLYGATNNNIWLRRFVADGTVDDYTRVSLGTTRYAYGGRVAVGPDGEAIMVWAEAIDADHGDIYWTTTSSGGQVVSTAPRLFASRNEPYDLAMALAPGATINVAWTDSDPPTGMQVRYRRGD